MSFSRPTCTSCPISSHLNSKVSGRRNSAVSAWRPSSLQPSQLRYQDWKILGFRDRFQCYRLSRGAQRVLKLRLSRGRVKAQVGDDNVDGENVNGETGKGNASGSGSENVNGETGKGSESGSGSENGFSRFGEALARGSKKYYQSLVKDSRAEAGIDIESWKAEAVEQVESLKEKADDAAELVKQRAQELREKFEEVKEQGTDVVETTQRKYWPQFVDWNRWELWKDVKKWNARRVGALVLYGLLVGASVRGVYSTVRNFRLDQTEEKLGEAYLEAVIPEPTKENLEKLKKGLWREQMPEDFLAQKWVAGPDGEYKRDPTYVGENAWAESDDEGESVEKIAEEGGLTEEEKAELDEIINMTRAHRGLPPRGTKVKPPAESFDNEANGVTQQSTQKNWQERLQEWDSLIKREQLKELVEQDKTKYVVPINKKEVRANMAEELVEREISSNKEWAFWVARRWWKYRPNMPYTYFLTKVESLEVAASVYSCDMKKLFVTMKDGFPSEYVVDIPVDPYLYEALSKCDVETDILSKSNFQFYGRAFLALLPTVLIILFIRALQYRAKEKFSETVYDLLKMNRRQLILPEDAVDKAKSQYKDVIVGGDIWMVLEEIMTYMRNPLKYHNQRVKLPRGILISGPPGTGKTLLARAIARESGLPFVFASGAEFVESSTGNGSDKIFDIFFTARANAPSFVFIDEIDALAGKNMNDDAERRATFQQLLAELDGEPEDTDVDRWSLRQAVILICATNRPDELDESFLQPGRIDREIHIGLPGEEERISIFGVHSSGKPLAKDVDFRKVVYRTLGYSGADIRNLINEAGIMAVRNGHEEITQQDFVDVLDKQLFEGMGVSLTDEEQIRTEAKIPMDNKRLLAMHEAGHVLLAHLYPRFDWHAFSHLLPGGSEYALTLFYPREEMVQQGHTTVGYLRMQMVVAHGGRCAERILFGNNVSDGGQDDLAKITQIARELTISRSNRRFGLFPMKWQDTLDPPKRPDETDLIPNEWDRTGSQIVQMSTEFSELFTREVTNYIEDTEQEAMEALQKNEHILRRLTEELLAKTKLSGSEAEDIILSMAPIMLPDPLLEPMNSTDEDAERLGPSMKGRYEEMVIYPAPLHRC